MNYLMDHILCQTFKIKKHEKPLLTIETTEVVLVPVIFLITFINMIILT